MMSYDASVTLLLESKDDGASDIPVVFRCSVDKWREWYGFGDTHVYETLRELTIENAYIDDAPVPIGNLDGFVYMPKDLIEVLLNRIIEDGLDE